MHALVPSHAALVPGTLSAPGVATEQNQPVALGHAALVAEGGVLYQTHCMSCHGERFEGTANVPSLVNAGGSAVDFYMQTGRMPAAVPGVQEVHEQPHFTLEQIAALDAYVGARAQVTIPIPRVVLDPAKLQHGRYLFENNCESCHGAAAVGATAGYGWIALPLDRASPTEIGEAIRIGPGVMPRWNARAISDDDIGAIATYVRYLTTTPQNYGGSTEAYLGVVIEGAIGAVVGIGGLFWVIYFTGTKTSGDRVHEG